jgi:RNA polymerase sigma-70 factor (ECF subfamily)
LIINLLNPIITNASLKSLSDEEALERYLSSQNVNYFNLLYDRYTNKVYSKCVSMLRDEEKAEDACQEIFVKVLLNLSKFNGKSKFSTWLYSISYNYCIDVIRKNKKFILVDIDDNPKANLVDDNIPDNEILEVKVNRLSDVLQEMPPDDKSILLMKYQDDFSIKEIAEMIQKSDSAVKMKIYRAKEKFVKIYNEKYSLVTD